MTDTDLELLARFARDRADEAFAELVRRHLGLVHSAALRQVRSPQLAEDVAQSAFLKLAQHARQLTPGTVLSAWLYQVTRREAIDVVRREARRQLREQIATEMNAMNATATDWTHIEPLLDDAMAALDETDRTAVLLRYFENKSLREVGEALGASENAAQKRLTRAVEHLREFFAKRGVAVGSGGLAVIISANAIQAAPVGLAVTISTAAALAGTAVTTAAAATATKALIMTTMQKTLIVATLVAVGTGIYESRQASTAREQVQTLLQQQAALTEKLEQTVRERESAMRQLAALRESGERSNGATAELLRLRGTVARLKAELQEMAQRQSSDTNNLTLSEAVAWRNRVQQLKQRLEQSPGAWIPELQLVTEQDWLNAARRKIDTEIDYRRALSGLRSVCEHKVASIFQKAVEAYRDANGERELSDLGQLQPYFESPLNPAIMERWYIASRESIPDIDIGIVDVGPFMVTQRAPVDDVFDERLVLGLSGFRLQSWDFLPWETMGPLYKAYRDAHNGRSQTDFSELQPYAMTPEQQVALQKITLRHSATDGPR